MNGFIENFELFRRKQIWLQRGNSERLIFLLRFSMTTCFRYTLRIDTKLGCKSAVCYSDYYSFSTKLDEQFFLVNPWLEIAPHFPKKFFELCVSCCNQGIMSVFPGACTSRSLETVKASPSEMEETTSMATDKR
jgi:hypothetical protein